MTSRVASTSTPRFRGEYYTDIAARSAYSEGAGPYRIVPAAVAVPATVDDLLLLIELALTRGMPLIPRGAGSGMPGGNVGRGIVVDLQRFNSPHRVFPAGRANVGAAVTWAALNRAASWHRLRLPPDPSSGAFCTIGGMVATNAAGARSLRYGSIRRWVRGVELVTADGEVGWLARAGTERHGRRPTRGQHRKFVSRLRAEERFERDVKDDVIRHRDGIQSRFPHTRKNSSGYALDEYLDSDDLVDLVIGSEGTLGIVTRIELDLDPVPEAVAALLLALHDLERLPEVVHALLRLGPAVVELLDQSFLRVADAEGALPFGEAEAVLIVEFERETDRAARAAAHDAVRATAPWCGYVQTAHLPSERRQLWAIRHAASPRLAALGHRRSLQIIEDGCVPVEHLGRYIAGVREAAARAGIDIVAFGHAGDGHLHVNALVDATTPTFEKRLQQLLTRVTDLLVELGGTVSGEHGDGRLRAPLVNRIYGAEILTVFRAMKAAFDPQGILNPGVILPLEDAEPVSNLKVGPGAAPIPDTTAAGLHEIERRGGWGRSKLELAQGVPRP